MTTQPESPVPAEGGELDLVADDAVRDVIAHDEAEQIALAYIDKAFGNPEKPGRRVRHCIPANPREDTDLRLMAYIRQRRRAEDALAQEAKEYRRLKLALEFLAEWWCSPGRLPADVFAKATELGWTEDPK